MVVPVCRPIDLLSTSPSDRPDREWPPSPPVVILRVRRRRITPHRVADGGPGTSGHRLWTVVPRPGGSRSQTRTNCRICRIECVPRSSRPIVRHGDAGSVLASRQCSEVTASLVPTSDRRSDRNSPGTSTAHARPARREMAITVRRLNLTSSRAATILNRGGSGTWRLRKDAPATPVEAPGRWSCIPRRGMPRITFTPIACWAASTLWRSAPAK